MPEVSCWAKHCRPGPCVHALFCGLLRKQRRRKTKTAHEELSRDQFVDHWSDGYVLAKEAVANEDMGDHALFEGVPRERFVMVTTMAGDDVATLPAHKMEAVSALKRRIEREEGTAPHMQKLVQENCVLEDSDVVVPGKPVSMVRIQRKLAVFASVHSDLRLYDVETGEAMRVASAQNLRLSCLACSWETSRCFTGSSDGVVRVWKIRGFEHCDLLETLQGLQEAVCAVCPGPDGRVSAAALDGSVRTWSVGSSDPPAHFQTEARGHIQIDADWPRGRLLIAGEGMPRHEVVAHDLASGELLWRFGLERGPTAGICVDWPGERCLVAPCLGLLELWDIGPSRQPLAKFGPRRLNQQGQQGLVRVDWAGGRAVMVVEPYALEVWSLQTFELLHRLRDVSGDSTELLSLDVDWSAPVPQAIVCRHFVDWDLVAGEVCIQHWELREGGEFRNVSADHPMVGGFDIVAAAAQV